MTRKVLGIAVLGLVLWNLMGCGGGTVVNRSGNYRLHGSISRTSGEGLPFSSIVLQGAPRGALADRNGEFSLGGILPGTYELTVLYLGYRSRVHPVRTGETDERSVTLEMVRDPRLGRAGADSLGPVTLTYRMTASPQEAK